MTGSVIPAWEPGPSNRASYDGVVASVGGPDSRYLPEHAHPDLQLSVHFGGTSSVRVIAPWEPHAGGWEPGEYVTVLLLSPALLAEVADDVVRGPWTFRSGSHPEDRLAHELGRAVWAGFADPLSIIDRRLYLESIAYTLACHLVRTYGEASVRRPSRDTLAPRQISVLREYLDAAQGRPVGLAEMAAALRLRPRAFADAFRQTTGLTPYQYAIHRRIRVAKRLLRLRGRSIGEIALQLGYSSPSHFTAAFVRLTGTTPSRFRRALRKSAG